MSSDERRFETRVETNRWESFTRLTFSYFVDQEYQVERNFDRKLGELELVFTDDDRDERAVFVYEGSPPDMAQESLQTMQNVFEGSMDATKFWQQMLGQ
ncbi:MAG: hypothetical protein ABEJ05_13100 [Haloglomus sp.]